MEKRQSKRLNVFFNTGIIFGDMKYDGFVGNISENGLYARISSAASQKVLPCQEAFDLRLRLPDDEIFWIKCNLVWSYEIEKRGSDCESAYNMGLKIVSPLPEYSIFYEKLLMKSLNENLKRYLY